MTGRRMRGAFLTVLALLLLAVWPAAAEERKTEAEELTASCEFQGIDKNGNINRLKDNNYKTYWESSKRKNPWVIISSETPIYGVYLCFRSMPEKYMLQRETEDGWETVLEGDSRFHHAFYAIDGLTRLRIVAGDNAKVILGFNEIFLFGKGDVPDWVQRWEPTREKADLLFLVAHPDDELLFMGGAIASYTYEHDCSVVIAYLSQSNTTRRSEALNGLWAMGIREYPVFGSFRDVYSKSGKLADAYDDITGGKKAVQGWITGLFRQYRPEVVVTHDLNGEYGHPQHKMVADSSIACVGLAANAAEYPESADVWGTWQVKKLYLHLYGDESNQTLFDWNVPIAEAGGKTGNDLSKIGYAQHLTQVGMGGKVHGKRVEFSVEAYGEELFPNTCFGLYASEVGPDETHLDFLEHIPELTGKRRAGDPEQPADGPSWETGETGETGETDGTAAPEGETTVEAENDGMGESMDSGATEETAEGAAIVETAGETGKQDETAAEPVLFQQVTPPEWADVTLNERGFLDEGEYVYADEENDRYMYASPTLRVVIERTIEEPDKKHPFYCFVAHIWCDIASGEMPTTVFADPEKPKKQHELIRKIATDNKVVFATSNDYYTYRIKADYGTGIEIRNGQIIFDDPNTKARYTGMPNYETLALFLDGTAASHDNREVGAEEYVQSGAWQVYTFGPCLVKDGKLTDYVAEANKSYNPRCAIGVAEPGHYVAMLCEGRVVRSKGVQMAYLAELLLREGCQLAVNMDGGQTAVFAFMGQQLNQVVKSDPYGRKQADVLAFGTSERVGEITINPYRKSK